MPKVPWIGTNWKMHKTRPEARAFARTLRASSIATSGSARPFVIPPYTAIADVADILAGTRVLVGAQNMHWADEGPHTGEISPPMLREVGARLIEIGHSERRTEFGETDEMVAMKAAAAVRHGFVALVCIGDTREEYEAGRTAAVLQRQVRAALAKIPAKGFGNVLLAYEPVWSIGEGGTPATPDFADEQHALVKAETRRFVPEGLEVLYGGSVNPGNCLELAGKPHIDGLFIGRSAWRAEDYIAIAERVTRFLADL
jgi:L-erythrulose 1-phosphate isomerase